MAEREFNLGSGVTVNADGIAIDADTKIDGVTFAESVKASVIETKHGWLTAAGDGIYDFTALSGGDFTFTDGTEASVRGFDGSGIASAIKVTVDNSSGNTLLKTVATGSGKDVVTATNVDGGTIDLGAGNDTINVAAGTATVALGAGADFVSVDVSDSATVSVSDYNYAEGDVISVTGGGFEFDCTTGTAKVTAASVEVNAKTALNNGVYEVNLNDTHYVRTDVSSVDYVATDAIDFASDEATTTLNLTLAGKTTDANTVSVGAGAGTVNIVAGRANASITVDGGVDFGLSIEKKGSVVSINNALDADDTLYLMDGGKISDVKFAAGGDLSYGQTTVKGAYGIAEAEGTFKYNINGEAGVLAYASVNTGTVTYAEGITYYANAATVDASEYGDVVLNLNGVCGDAFDESITTIKGVTSGLVAGRDKVDNTITVETEAGKKTEVYGGVAGNDTINLSAVDSDSTNVIWYSNGDGNDSVTGFTQGNNSVYFHDAAAAASILNEVASVSGSDLEIAMDKSNKLTLYGVQDATETNVINFSDVAGNTFKVAVGAATGTVTYASDVNIYKGATTLKVEGEEDMIIYTGANNDQYGYYDEKITAIDASEASGTLYLSGTNTNGMTITGGTGTNHMWGGGDKVQTLVADGDAVNVFWFGAGDGRDAALGADGEDGVNLYNVEKIDDVAIKASTNYFTVTVGNDSLKVNLATGTTAEDALKTFTFADQAGVLYTYNTETNKFQQK